MDDNIINKKVSTWKRPWNLTKYDDLYNRDERFLSVVVKGMLLWLNSHIVMYDAPINHFIFSTGSSYMYVENNGYEFSWKEATGEDMIYMHLPRCVVSMDGVSVENEELSSGYSHGTYERRDGDEIKGYNGEIKRIPLAIKMTLHYALGTMNETLILIQELIDRVLFQKYYNVTYLGNIIQCSIEFPETLDAQLNKVDLGSADPNQKTLDLSVTLNTSYPNINERTESENRYIIEKFKEGLVPVTNSYLQAHMVDLTGFEEVSHVVHTVKDNVSLNFKDNIYKYEHIDIPDDTYSYRVMRLRYYDGSAKSYMPASYLDDYFTFAETVGSYNIYVNDDRSTYMYDDSSHTSRQYTKASDGSYIIPYSKRPYVNTEILPLTGSEYEKLYAYGAYLKGIRYTDKGTGIFTEDYGEFMDMQYSYIPPEEADRDRFTLVASKVSYLLADTTWWNRKTNMFRFTESTYDPMTGLWTDSPDRYYDAYTSSYVSYMAPYVHDWRMSKFDANRNAYVMYSGKYNLYAYWYYMDGTYMYVDGGHAQYTKVDRDGVPVTYMLSVRTDIRLYPDDPNLAGTAYTDVDSNDVPLF